MPQYGLASIRFVGRPFVHRQCSYLQYLTYKGQARLPLRRRYAGDLFYCRAGFDTLSKGAFSGAYYRAAVVVNSIASN